MRLCEVLLPAPLGKDWPVWPCKTPMTQLPKSDPTQLRAEIHRTLDARVDWFTRHYDIVSHHALGVNSDRVHLGDKAKHVCR